MRGCNSAVIAGQWLPPRENDDRLGVSDEFGRIGVDQGFHQHATRNHRTQPPPCHHEQDVPSIFPSHPQNDITPHHCRNNTLSHRPPIARRFYLTSSASFGIAARALAAAPGPVLAISVDDARSQWAAACKATDRLLSDWDTLSSGGGDAVRRELGTVGTSSPLFQLNKAVRVLQEEASDPIEWGENSEELLLSLGRADSIGV